MIKINELSRRYSSGFALSNVTYTFEAGNVYGIAGENGAGKTTLFRCIAGLESHEGEIVADFTPLKNHLGFLVTEPYFFDKITGKEYLQLIANARGKQLVDAISTNIFDLPLNQYASNYSTGMKKKLALTGILLQQNQYYIFDEPYNGVDIQSNMLITEIIRELRKLGKTVLLSSHIFSTLSENCDFILHLKAGLLVKTIGKSEFGQLENEMKETSLKNKIEQLGLQ